MTDDVAIIKLECSIEGYRDGTWRACMKFGTTGARSKPFPTEDQARAELDRMVELVRAYVPPQALAHGYEITFHRMQ